MDRPLILFDGTEEELARLKEDLQQEGWKLLYGWNLPQIGWDLGTDRTVCVGQVRTEEDAEAAVIAAARGTGILAIVSPGDPVAGSLLENLERVGPVEHRSSSTGKTSGLTPGDGRLLSLLGEGLSVTEAAQALHISRRTAERRLAHIRRALNVGSTSEAVVVAKRMRSQGQLPE